jgi:hypothetical protein
VLAYLQMRCQPATASFALSLVCGASLACGQSNSAVSPITSASTPESGPELSLSGVAFVRTVEGRVIARGTASRLDYRRAGGRLDANVTAMTLLPQPGSRTASFGAMSFSAPHATGEVVEKRGLAWGGVKFSSTRGDKAATEAVEYGDDLIHGEKPVVASGPGYSMKGNGLVAKADGSEASLTNGAGGTLEVSP